MLLLLLLLLHLMRMHDFGRATSGQSDRLAFLQTTQQRSLSKSNRLIQISDRSIQMTEPNKSTRLHTLGTPRFLAARTSRAAGNDGSLERGVSKG